MKCPKTEPHEPHWHVVRAGSTPVAQGNCSGAGSPHADRDRSEQPVWPPHARAAYLDEPVPYVPAESADDAGLRARIDALGGEPYVLADILCHLYHDYDIGALTGFATEQGVVVSCADCKAKAREVLACLKTTLDGPQ